MLSDPTMARRPAAAASFIPRNEVHVLIVSSGPYQAELDFIVTQGYDIISIVLHG